MRNELPMELLNLVVAKRTSVYKSLTSNYRDTIIESISQINTILSIYNIHVSTDYWWQVKVWEGIPDKNVSEFVKDKMDYIETLQEDCDEIHQWLKKLSDYCIEIEEKD